MPSEPSCKEYACNPSFLGNATGILKVVETILSLICFGLILHYFRGLNSDRSYGGSALDQGAGFMFCVSFGFFLSSALMLIGSMMHPYTAHILPRTIFESLHHIFAGILFMAAGTYLLIQTVQKNNDLKILIGIKDPGYNGKIAAAVLGLINGILHALSQNLTNKIRKEG
ncbi:MARVEL domain-containing protein [Caerostris darwini]|uniref:MARVEL domain-containing protein n=1 Tax=Caerostris darwini TaxID=1538125 RepID=A0AAV4UYU5_9ARAC|nr:MARVEL domain-containing protein [Caerostris darwini]